MAPERTIYWRTTAPVEPGPPLEGDVNCDVCIVGGGYTGLWTAHFLRQAEPSLDIHVLEAEYAGAGASGHNDGFVTPTIGHSLENVVRRFGPEAARAGYAAVGRSIAELGAFCRRNHIEAEYEPNGMFMVAVRPGQVRRLERDQELAASLGAKVELLGRDEAQARIGSPAIEAALEGVGALVNPHKLARGLAGVVRKSGTVIHERTTALRVGRVPGGHAVTTPHGRVVAERVVLATNAYQHRFTPFRRDVVPVWSYAAVTEPVPEGWIEELPWEGREGFVEARNFVVFARLTAENRLLLGGGPAPYRYGRDMDERHLRDGVAEDAIRAALERHFPRWRALRFEYVYGGCIAVTRNLVPHVGALRPGLYYGHGYCGNGIAATHTAGKALRDLVLERDTDYSNLLFVRAREPRFPPEPLIFAASQVASRALAWQDEHPELAARAVV